MPENSASLLASFIEEIAHARGYSPHTLRAYERDVREFLSFLRYAGLCLDDLTARTFRDYLAKLALKKLSSSTVARKLSAIKSFLGYCEECGAVSGNPSLLILFPRVRRTLRHVPSEEEMAKLLDAKVPSTPIAVRNWAIVELLYSCGIRVSELVGIDLQDVDLERREIKVRGKGGRERLVFFGKRAENVLKRYIFDHRVNLASAKKGRHEEALFLNRFGKRLTDRGVRKVVRSWMKRAGISATISPHGFRHAFATHLLKSGADIRSVQELLGHRSATTTQVYTQLDAWDLKFEHMLTHPRG